MKKIALLLLVAVFAAGCAEAEVNVVCSLFPQYDFAKAIAGERATVSKLLPDGIDSHEYEPSVRNMLNTDAADLFIYTDPELEAWVETFSGGFSHVKTVRCAEGIDLEALSADHAEEHDEHGHSYDAHIWLDPTLAVVMCENICDALTQIDPEGSEVYAKNCADYVAQLNELDADFMRLFSEHADAELYFGGKFAYSHFLRHYNVKYLTAYDGCSDEGEPGARAVINIAKEMTKHGANIIFTDEMSSGDVASAIAEQTGARVLVFHTAHNVSKEDRESGLTFLDIMRGNLENIKAALE